MMKDKGKYTAGQAKNCNGGILTAEFGIRLGSRGTGLYAVGSQLNDRPTTETAPSQRPVRFPGRGFRPARFCRYSGEFTCQ